MTAPGEAHRRKWIGYVAALVVGILVTLGTVAILNGGPIIPARTPAPGTVQLFAIQTVFHYVDGGAPIYGVSQEGCANCPLTLTGGTVIGFNDVSMEYSVPNASVTVSWNATSPIPFMSWACENGALTPSCPYVTSSSASGVELGCGTGNGVGLGLVLSIPNPAPAYQNGGPYSWTFQITANVTETACST